MHSLRTNSEVSNARSLYTDHVETFCGNPLLARTTMLHKNTIYHTRHNIRHFIGLTYMSGSNNPNPHNILKILKCGSNILKTDGTGINLHNVSMHQMSLRYTKECFFLEYDTSVSATLQLLILQFQ